MQKIDYNSFVSLSSV